MVSLIGAGPGNPELLTLRAVECLSQADLVIYDQLVPTGVLKHAPTAEHRCVDDFPGEHPNRWPAVCQAMIDAAQQGRRVVRLKGGDPSIFAKTAEEVEKLRAANVSFEIVPGVTSALGAAAYAGFPLTQRTRASAVALVTGHEDPDKADSLLDWEALAKFPGTLVFYMGIRRIEKIVAALIEHGKDGTAPAALVHRATLGEQRTLEASLEDLPRVAREQNVAAPTLIVIGSVLELRTSMNWFERLPLFGKRILLTRPSHQSQSTIQKLERLGATAYSLPTVEIHEPADWSDADRALSQLADYHWVVFTSVNGVHYFVQRLKHHGKDLRALGHLRLAVIGPSTADAVREYHLEPDLIPDEYRSEALVEALKEHVSGQRVLLARANRGRALLREELQIVADVEQVTVYDQRDVKQIPEDVHDLIRRGEMDYVTLTAPNVARSLFQLLDDDARAQIQSGRVKLISISPVTSGTVREELQWNVTAEATTYTLDGVIDALIDHASGS